MSSGRVADLSAVLAPSPVVSAPPPPPKRIAWEGGVILTNKHFAMMEFLKRKLRSGATLTPEQMRIIEQSGVLEAPRTLATKNALVVERPHTVVKQIDGTQEQVVTLVPSAPDAAAAAAAPAAVLLPHHASSKHKHHGAKAPTQPSAQRASVFSRLGFNRRAGGADGGDAAAASQKAAASDVSRVVSLTGTVSALLQKRRRKRVNSEPIIMPASRTPTRPGGVASVGAPTSKTPPPLPISLESRLSGALSTPRSPLPPGGMGAGATTTSSASKAHAASVASRKRRRAGKHPQ